MMLRLAFLAPEFIPAWGGVGAYSEELVRSLSKRGDIEIHVLTPSRGAQFDPKAVEANFGGRIKVHAISKASDTFFYNFHFQRAVLRELPRLHKLHSFDLIHSANLVQMPDIFQKLFRRLDIPTVCTIHSTIQSQVRASLDSSKKLWKMGPSEYLSLMLYPVISTLQSAYVRRTTRFITVSRKMAISLEKQLGVHPITPVHNGVDLDLFRKHKGGFPDVSAAAGKRPVILYSGRLVSQKGLSLFVRLMEELDAFFVIAGSGEPDVILRQLRNIPIEKYMFLGHVDRKELPGLYGTSDIFVLPSYSENLPMSILESMAMGCSVVSTDVGAVDEMVEHGKTGLLCRPGDYTGLKHEVASLIEDPRKRKSLAEAALKKVRKEFNSDRMADKTLDVYKEVIR